MSPSTSNTNARRTSTTSIRRISSRVSRVTLFVTVAALLLLSSLISMTEAKEGGLRRQEDDSNVIDSIQEDNFEFEDSLGTMDAAIQDEEEEDFLVSDLSYESTDYLLELLQAAEEDPDFEFDTDTDLTFEEELFSHDTTGEHRALARPPNGYCNVCGWTPKGQRFLAKPGKQFWMNGKKWTCGQIKEQMQDVRVGPWAAHGEERWCAQVQSVVLQKCQCYGAELVDEYKDPNPGCKLCPQGKSVPGWKSDRLTDTGLYGHMNCKGLEQAMKEGVFPANKCGFLKQQSKAQCCA